MNPEEELKKKKYGLYKNSAVQICLWTKNSLRNEGVCFKQKFYGIQCHRCMQFSPTMLCNLRCVYCWRPMEIERQAATEQEPERIINNLIKERKKLMNGFGSYVEKGKISRQKFREATEPNFFTFSLIGESTLYPKLPEMIKLLKKKGVVFLVTNGTVPEMLERLSKEVALPTQLTLTLASSNKKDFEKISRPLSKDCWEKINQTLKLFKKIECRKVIRIILMNKINDDEKKIEEFAQLIKTAEPDFIHIKAYMWIGFSRERLKKENMPTNKEVKEFAKKILKFLKGYKIDGEQEISRVVLLSNGKKEKRITL
jgi:tRNA wybutosine-synthesizing protein 1